MSSVDLVDPARRPQRILFYALVPPAALLSFGLLVVVLEHALTTRPTLDELAINLLALLVAALLSFIGTALIVVRSSHPFLTLTAATRAVAADPTRGAAGIPLAGEPNTVELACAIRALIETFITLRASHEGLLRAIDRGPVGLLWVAGGSGSIRYLNPAFCRLLGWPPSPVCLGHRLEEIDPDAVASVSIEGRARLAAGELWSVRRDVFDSDGLRRLDFTSVPVPGDGADGPSYLVFVEDRTSQAERDELRERHAGASAALPGLAASVAASRGLLELALRDPLLPGPLRADLGAIRDGTAEAARLLGPFTGRVTA
jgi:PAS domain-containing protein